MSNNDTPLFQLASDIHLELLHESTKQKLLKYIENIIIPTAQNLILAGDIGHSHRPNYKYFINWCSENFKRVFVISGNHEYYTTSSMMKKHTYTIKDIDHRLQEVCNEFDNVYFLQKDRFEFIEYNVKYIILGCTFWAPIKKKKNILLP